MKLGEVIVEGLKTNPDGIEVAITDLASEGIDLRSVEYSDWLNKFGLREQYRTRRYVCFIKLP